MLTKQEPIILAENLSFRYRDKEEYAIKDVNLKIYEGELVLIAGSSGSGKSTFVQMLNGIIPYAIRGKKEGYLEVAGMNTDKTSIEKLSKVVGMVFQDPETQLFEITVEDEVALALENMGLPREEILKRLKMSLKLTANAKKSFIQIMCAGVMKTA